MEASAHDSLLEEAEVAVGRYVMEPAYRGGTNRVILGSAKGAPIVFKYFCGRGRWVNELFCLRHFAPAGIVPRVLDVVPERLIVMERLGGSDGLGEIEAGSATPGQVRDQSGQIGRALGKIANTPLPTNAEGYSPLRDWNGLGWTPLPSRMLERYATASRRVQRVIPAYGCAFASASLSLLASQKKRVDRERQILFHEDIWNLQTERDRFLGFCDLEMCRPGTESMQLGVAVELCGPQRLEWRHLQHGYEEEVGRRLADADLVAALAMNHFYHWIRACRWGHWDGDPAETEHLRASTQDAEHHLARMEMACHVLGAHVDVAEWFGCC